MLSKCTFHWLTFYSCTTARMALALDLQGVEEIRSQPPTENEGVKCATRSPKKHWFSINSPVKIAFWVLLGCEWSNSAPTHIENTTGFGTEQSVGFYILQPRVTLFLLQECFGNGATAMWATRGRAPPKLFRPAISSILVPGSQISQHCMGLVLQVIFQPAAGQTKQL